MIAVVFALDFEGKQFAATDRLCVSKWVLHSVGVAAALRLEQRLSSTRPKMIISAGFSGGLVNALSIGDIVMNDPIIPQMRQRAFIGKLVTADRVVGTALDKMALGKMTGAWAVDCETDHLNEVCSRYGVPMISIRCISDIVSENIPIPDEILIDKKTARPRTGRIIRHILGHPTRWMDYYKFIRNSYHAQIRLASAIQQAIPAILSARS